MIRGLTSGILSFVATTEVGLAKWQPVGKNCGWGFIGGKRLVAFLGELKSGFWKAIPWFPTFCTYQTGIKLECGQIGISDATTAHKEARV
jgi:hypothetical protein